MTDTAHRADLTAISAANSARSHPEPEFPACTLAPTALNDRIEEIKAIGADSLIAAVSETEFRASGPGSQAFHIAFTAA